jgi:hypothetical protein
LRHSGRAKGVGFDQICASGQIAFVNVTNHIGASQAQQFIVAFDVFVKIFEALAPILRFAQFEALNHGAHCTVQNGDAVLQNFGQLLGACVGLVHPAIVRRWTIALLCNTRISLQLQPKHACIAVPQALQ